MKTIGIITCYDPTNYGNRLQNYASQTLIEGIGNVAISYVEKKKKTKPVLLSDCKFLFNYFKNKVLHTGYNTSIKQYRCFRNRKKSFISFQKKIATKYVTRINTLNTCADYFVVGSDQVWQPKWWVHHDSQLFLLSFARPEQKICLSPSFGSERLEEKYVPLFKKELSSFAKLASREVSGAGIIKSLTGKNAEVTIDPTLMLDSKEWQNISIKPNASINNDYILTYFLGSIPELAKADIDHLLNKSPKLSVYRLNDPTCYDMYACGPSEFLYMINNARIVLTDSFHACVFSFLFSKPFLVYDRTITSSSPSMTSRITTFLHTFHLERKHRIGPSSLDWYECNYKEGAMILEKERERLNLFLTTAFKQ